MELRGRVVCATHVAGGGYRTIPGSNGEKWIVPVGVEDQPRDPTSLKPIGALHQRFAALWNFSDDEEFEQAALQFASRYGRLGIARAMPGSEVAGELLADWRQQAFELNEAMRGWQLSRHGSLAEMNEFLSLYGQQTAERMTVSSKGGQVLTSFNYDMSKPHPLLPYKRKSQAAEHLREFVTSRVNNAVMGLQTPTADEPDDVRRPAVPLACPLLVIYRDRAEMRDLAVTLLGYLWLEFAYGLDRKAEEQTCANCGQAFVIDNRRGTRKSRKYCGDSCRVAAYQQRKRDAVSLNERGESASAIARRLGTDTKTVRGWISAHKTQRRK